MIYTCQLSCTLIRESHACRGLKTLMSRIGQFLTPDSQSQKTGSLTEQRENLIHFDIQQETNSQIKKLVFEL